MDQRASHSRLLIAALALLAPAAALAEPKEAPGAVATPSAKDEPAPVTHYVPEEGLAEWSRPKRVTKSRFRVSAGYAMEERDNRDDDSGASVGFTYRKREFNQDDPAHFPAGGFEVDARFSNLGKGGDGSKLELGYIPGRAWVFSVRGERSGVSQKVVLDVGKIRGHYEYRGESAVFVGVCLESSPSHPDDAAVGAAFRIGWDQRITPLLEIHGNLQACIGQGVGSEVAGDKGAVGSMGIQIGALLHLNDTFYLQADWSVDWRSSLRTDGKTLNDHHSQGEQAASTTTVLSAGANF